MGRIAAAGVAGHHLTDKPPNLAAGYPKASYGLDGYSDSPNLDRDLNADEMPGCTMDYSVRTVSDPALWKAQRIAE